MLFWKQKGGGTSAKGTSIEVLRGVGCGEGVSPSPLGKWFGEGAVPPPQKNFSFWSSKLLVFSCILSIIFVSSSMTDGLHWDNLSGSVAQWNRENPQDPNGRSRSNSLSFNLSRVLKSTSMTEIRYGELLSNSSSKKWAVRSMPNPITSSTYY